MDFLGPLLLLCTSVCVFILISRQKTKISVGLLIRSYNRPEYLEALYNSLQKSDYNLCAEKVVYDDGSTHPEMGRVLSKFKKAGFRVVQQSNVGNTKSMHIALASLKKSPKYICYLDDDCMVNKNFISVLHKTYNRIHNMGVLHERILLSGFNCVPPNCAHSIISSEMGHKYGFVRKKTIGGISMFFHRSLTEFIGSTWSQDLDWGVCKKHTDRGGGIFVTSPSVVQHVGMTGENSFGQQRFDYALDFHP